MRIQTALISIALIFLVSGTLLSQPNKYGVPLITNYEHYITQGSEQNWCVTQDLRGVIYVGNNDKGVLEYDGEEWRNIPLPNDPIVRSIITGDNGVVYVGAESEFGFLAPNGLGSMEYHSLSDTIDQEEHPFTSVWRTYYLQGKVYFCTYTKIFVFDHVLDELSILVIPEYTFFSFVVDSTLYVSDFGSGLMTCVDDEFTLAKGGDFFREKMITGMARFDPQHILIATYVNGLFLYHEESGMIDGSFVEPGLNEYFMNGETTYLRHLNNDFLLTTLYDGLVILNREGEAREIITEAEGLIDESIPFAYSNDRLEGTGPVWIANYMGISKLETNNPFRVFTEESGFKGFITDIKSFNGRLFISTFSGVFFKNSTSTSTSFIPIPEIQDEDIRFLHVFNPSPGVELLLACSEATTYVIDRNMRVSVLADRVMNPHEDLQLREEYSGDYLVQDPDRPEVIYTGRSDIVGLEYINGRWKEIIRVQNLGEERMLKMGIDKYGYLWTSTPRRVIRVDISLKQDATLKFLHQDDGLPSNEKNQVFIDPNTDEILIGTRDGFYRFNYFRDTVYRDTIYNTVLPPGSNLVHAFHQDHHGDYWFSFENENSGWTELVARRNGNQLEVIRQSIFHRLPNTSVDVFFSDTEEGVWFGKSNELYHFDKLFSRNDSIPFKTLIRSVTVNADSVLFKGANYTSNLKGGFLLHDSQDEDTRPQISFKYNNIEFRWAAPYFKQEEELKYSYNLVGFDEHWSEWSYAAYKDFTNLPYGDYTLHVKALNVYGDESLPAFYSFTILRPWYATFLAIIGYIILSGLIVYLIIKIYTRRLKQENLRLEGIIQERTAEIRKQKEELTDSIEYASRIQRALLPPDRLMDDHHIEHFILFRPRDIVSGDFYWMGQKNDKLLIVAADCTGHGVPGAFMSMLGMTFLDEIVIKSEITRTDQILEQLRDHVISSLKQSGKSIEESTKDGMDLSMISIDINSHEIQFSGAYNPLYLVRKLKASEKNKLNKGEELDLPRGSIHDDKHLLLQMRADQMPIGISEKTLPFTSTTIKNENYSVYMFSDGYLDQFGGPQGKKFMSKNFKKLILELQSVPLKDQGAALEKVLLGWMGEISQIDDILVMGIRMDKH